MSSDNTSMCKSLNFCGRPNRVPRSDDGARVGEGVTPRGVGLPPLQYRTEDIDAQITVWSKWLPGKAAPE